MMNTVVLVSKSEWPVHSSGKLSPGMFANLWLVAKMKAPEARFR